MSKNSFLCRFRCEFKEGFELVKKFAMENGAAIAATRAVVDNRWAIFLNNWPDRFNNKTGSIHWFWCFRCNSSYYGMRHSRKIIAIIKIQEHRYLKYLIIV